MPFFCLSSIVSIQLLNSDDFYRGRSFADAFYAIVNSAALSKLAVAFSSNRRTRGIEFVRIILPVCNLHNVTDVNLMIQKRDKMLTQFLSLHRALLFQQKQFTGLFVARVSCQGN